MNTEKKSTRDYFSEFIIYKHSLGYVYETQRQYLERYVAYEESAGETASLSKESIHNYIDSLTDSPGTLYGTVSALREFARYLNNRGVQAYKIPNKTVSQGTPEPPYFFTEAEISAFFQEADKLPPTSRYKGREVTVPAFFRTMYCCGLRCKEARMLRCEDTALSDRYFDVIKSKGRKDRRIYISGELADYLNRYDTIVSGYYPDREYFFPGYSSTAYLSEGFICGNFNSIWKKAFPNMPAENFPRAYDFRHHFAWANINKWAAEGMDVNVMLPYLMRYMGHKTLRQTLYYFHFVPEFYSPYLELAGSMDDILPEVP